MDPPSPPQTDASMTSPQTPLKLASHTDSFDATSPPRDGLSPRSISAVSADAIYGLAFEQGRATAQHALAGATPSQTASRALLSPALLAAARSPVPESPQSPSAEARSPSHAPPRRSLTLETQRIHRSPPTAIRSESSSSSQRSLLRKDSADLPAHSPPSPRGLLSPKANGSSPGTEPPLSPGAARLIRDLSQLKNANAHSAAAEWMAKKADVPSGSASSQALKKALSGSSRGSTSRPPASLPFKSRTLKSPPARSSTVSGAAIGTSASATPQASPDRTIERAPTLPRSFAKRPSLSGTPNPKLAGAKGRLKAARAKYATAYLSTDNARFAGMLSELARVDKSVHEKESDVLLAAEIGQLLVEQNARLEASRGELMDQLEKETQFRASIERSHQALRKRCEELESLLKAAVASDPSARSRAAAALGQPVPEEEDLEQEELTLADFLKGELVRHSEYTGDTQADLRTFRRSLARERRRWESRQAGLEESLANLREDMEEAQRDSDRLRSELAVSQKLQEEYKKQKVQLEEAVEQARQRNILQLQECGRTVREAQNAHKIAEEDLKTEIARLKDRVATAEQQSSTLQAQLAQSLLAAETQEAARPLTPSRSVPAHMTAARGAPSFPAAYGVPLPGQSSPRTAANGPRRRGHMKSPSTPGWSHSPLSSPSAAPLVSGLSAATVPTARKAKARGRQQSAAVLPSIVPELTEDSAALALPPSVSGASPIVPRAPASAAAASESEAQSTPRREEVHVRFQEEVSPSAPADLHRAVSAQSGHSDSSVSGSEPAEGTPREEVSFVVTAPSEPAGPDSSRSGGEDPSELAEYEEDAEAEDGEYEDEEEEEPQTLEELYARAEQDCYALVDENTALRDQLQEAERQIQELNGLYEEEKRKSEEMGQLQAMAGAPYHVTVSGIDATAVSGGPSSTTGSSESFGSTLRVESMSAEEAARHPGRLRPSYSLHEQMLEEAARGAMDSLEESTESAEPGPSTDVVPASASDIAAPVAVESSARPAPTPASTVAAPQVASPPSRQLVPVSDPPPLSAFDEKQYVTGPGAGRSDRIDIQELSSAFRVRLPVNSSHLSPVVLARLDKVSQLCKKQWTLAVRLVLASTVHVNRHSGTNLKPLQLPKWVPDEHSSMCSVCQDEFWLFGRRHHCRLCGALFCSRCCWKKMPTDEFVLVSSKGTKKGSSDLEEEAVPASSLVDVSASARSSVKCCDSCSLVLELVRLREAHEKEMQHNTATAAAVRTGGVPNDKRSKS